MIDELKSAALELGACAKINRANELPALAALMFTPQGLEFCQQNNYPSLGTLRPLKDQLIGLDIWVDAGEITLDGPRQVCIAGDTSATIDVAGVKHVYTIVVMHGARAVINASDYAVLNIVRIGSANITIHQDKTVVIL